MNLKFGSRVRCDYQLFVWNQLLLTVLQEDFPKKSDLNWNSSSLKYKNRKIIILMAGKMRRSSNVPP